MYKLKCSSSLISKIIISILLLIIVVVIGIVILELRGPKSKVVSHQLHDGSGVLVVALLDVLDISDGIIEGHLGQLAGLLWVVLDLIVED